MWIVTSRSAGTRKNAGLIRKKYSRTASATQTIRSMRGFKNRSHDTGLKKLTFPTIPRYATILTDKPRLAASPCCSALLPKRCSTS